MISKNQPMRTKASLLRDFSIASAPTITLAFVAGGNFNAFLSWIPGIISHFISQFHLQSDRLQAVACFKLLRTVYVSEKLTSAYSADCRIA